MGIQYRSSRKCPKQRERRRSRKRRRYLACAILKRHSTTLSFTLPISQAEKPTLVSLVARRSRLTEKNHLLTLLCLPPLTSSKNSRSSVSTPSTSSSEAWAEWKPRHRDQELNQRSEHLQETGLRLAGLRMSLLLLPIQPEEGAAAEVEDFEQSKELVSERRHNFSGWCAFTD